MTLHEPVKQQLTTQVQNLQQQLLQQNQLQQHQNKLLQLQQQQIQELKEHMLKQHHSIVFLQKQISEQQFSLAPPIQPENSLFGLPALAHLPQTNEGTTLLVTSLSRPPP